MNGAWFALEGAIDPVPQAGTIDPFWATVVTVVGGIVTAVVIWALSRKKTDEPSVVKALLERIAALEAKDEARDITDAEIRADLAEAHRERDDAKEQLAAVRAELATVWERAKDQADQIEFYKAWGATAAGDPPRPIPPWRTI